ncbi:MAG: RES domain-containing protein [Alphaproteobacteria bacterium]|nr:RES domain-containing protein [Alphaproteobacteria bacterium]
MSRVPRVFRIAAQDAFKGFPNLVPKRHAGRWRRPGDVVIYFALSSASAVLEFIAHAEIDSATAAHARPTLWIYDAPPRFKRAALAAETLPDGWERDWDVCQRAAATASGVHAVLVTPSAIAPAENNWVVYPERLSAPFPLIERVTFDLDPRTLEPSRRRRGRPGS